MSELLVKMYEELQKDKPWESRKWKGKRVSKMTRTMLKVLYHDMTEIKLLAVLGESEDRAMTVAEVKENGGDALDWYNYWAA